jgi:hypothetical protein
MKKGKIPPEDDFFSMDKVLRQLTPEQFAQLDHNLDVRIRRINMRRSVIEGGKSKNGKEVRRG